MIRIPILRNPVPGSPAEQLLNRMLAVEQQIEQRAYELYCEHTASPDPTSDWKAAESEMICKPAMELAESPTEFHVRIALPGVDARSLRVAAVDDALLVEADCSREPLGKVTVNELPCKTLYRKIALNQNIRIDTVTAVLQRGLLHLTATKAAAIRPAFAAGA